MTRVVGGAFVALMATLLAINVVWIVRHGDRLRPFGKGDVAPNFVVSRADGQGTVDLSALRGHVVVIDFWATWCGPCRESMPVLERIYAKYHRAGLELASINSDGGTVDAARVLAFARRYGLTFPVAIDDGRASALYRVDSVPRILIVDKAGLIRAEHLGVFSAARLEKELDERVAELLAER